MNNLTLRQLRYFQALAREGHFGRAAESCSVCQPALSVRIKELEETIGQQLFERSARQVRLSSFGEGFARRVQDILQSVDELGDLARAAQQQFVGRLRIGVIPTIAPYLLPTMIKNLTTNFPELDLQLRETTTPRLIDELKAGQLDTAILALPVSEPTFEELPLFEESFVLVRPAAEANLPVPDKDSLREMRLLLLEEGHCFRDQALSFCELPQTTPREMMDASSLSTLVQMVGVGIGVTLLPEMAIGVETRSANVSVASFPDPKPSRHIGMVWRRKNPMAPKLRHIAKAVKDARPEA